MVIPIGVCTPTGPQRGARNPCTLFRVRFSWASLFQWYALKNARVPPAIVLSRLRRAKNGQTPGRGPKGIIEVVVVGFSPRSCGHRPHLQFRQAAVVLVIRISRLARPVLNPTTSAVPDCHAA